MKVLWVVNGILYDAAAAFGCKTVVTTTWLENVLNNIKDKCELIVCAPFYGTKEIKYAEVNGVAYYGIPGKHKRRDKYEKQMKGFWHQVFQKEQPDIIHIWGTEFPHTLSAVEAAESSGFLDYTIVSIQGLVSVYWKHYMNEIPWRVQHLMTPKNMIRGFNIYQSQQSFRKRGKYEIEALRRVRHVIGRTDWDKACTTQIHRDIKYHFNNETLRPAFYEGSWEQQKCKQYNIFASKGEIPIKGTHHIIEAMKLLQEKYPDIHLTITGRDILGHLTVKQALSLNPYDWYIRKMIKKNGLEHKVTFLGTLNAEQMKEEYLKTNVYVLPSSIENSPNSLGEAMLLGVPAVAADVGGVSNLAKDDEIYLYPHDEPYMLAYYISRIFDEPDNAEKMGERARKHALQTHDADRNIEELLQIYQEIRV